MLKRYIKHTLKNIQLNNMEKEQVNSVTYDVTLPSGISALFTIRENDKTKIKELLDTTLAFDKLLIEKGIKPHVRSFGAGAVKKDKEWTGDKCPKDGGRLHHMVTKTGKDMLKCENSKYDFATKTSSGCDYIGWGKNLEDVRARADAWKQAKVTNASGESVDPSDIPF